MQLFKVAVVGAGPAGYFAAQALQSAEIDGKKFAIDMIEKLPTPWGLVRSGVGPKAIITIVTSNFKCAGRNDKSFARKCFR